MKVHVQRWMKRDIMAELAPGLILAGDEIGKTRFLSPGMLCQGGIHAKGLVGVTAQVFWVRREWNGALERETACAVGVSIGGQAGLAALPVLMIVGFSGFDHAVPTP